MTKQSLFARFARAASNFTGASTAFMLAALIIIIWGISGPLFGFSDTWQLVINTGTTIVTFLMVFLIQNTQNRDSQAVHIKLDELIHSIRAAGNDILDAEDMNDKQLAAARDRYANLGKRARDIADPTSPSGSPELQALAADAEKSAAAFNRELAKEQEHTAEHLSDDAEQLDREASASRK